MNSTIYLRGLRHVDFSVFAVTEDQKNTTIFNLNDMYHIQVVNK